MMIIRAHGRPRRDANHLDLEYSQSTVFFTWAGFNQWTSTAAPDRPNCSKAAPSRSSSPITSASEPNA